MKMVARLLVVTTLLFFPLGCSTPPQNRDPLFNPTIPKTGNGGAATGPKVPAGEFNIGGGGGHIALIVIGAIAVVAIVVYVVDKIKKGRQNDDPSTYHPLPAQ